jgi:hypothetical protein
MRIGARDYARSHPPISKRLKEEKLMKRPRCTFSKMPSFQHRAAPLAIRERFPSKIESAHRGPLRATTETIERFLSSGSRLHATATQFRE